MRAKEFIPEGQERAELRKGVAQSMSNLTVYDRLDNNNNPYLAYRFGIALAGSPTEDIDKRSAIGSDFVMADYTGHRGRLVADRGSREPKTTETASPVSKPKRNKYGV